MTSGRRPLSQGSSPLIFRDADNPGTEIIIYEGADEYDELARKWRTGYRYMTRSGRPLRNPVETGARRAPRDYPAESHDYLADPVGDYLL